MLFIDIYINVKPLMKAKEWLFLVNGEHGEGICKKRKAVF